MKYILALSFLIFLACKTDKQTPVSEESKKALPQKENMSEIATKLYAYYTANPTTQAQIDENALINYAVDNNLDVSRTASGLYYLLEEKGDGPLLTWGQPCQAHYNGYFLDGKIFDSSYNRNKPIVFSIGQMNKGWNEGLQLMNVGTKGKLLLPSHLGYGEKGFPGYVPPNTPIIFDLEILPIDQ